MAGRTSWATAATRSPTPAPETRPVSRRPPAVLPCPPSQRPCALPAQRWTHARWRIIQSHQHVNLPYCFWNVLWTNMDQANAAKMFHQRRVILLLSYSFALFVWFILEDEKYVSVRIISRVMETVWGRVMLGTWRCAATTGAGPTRAWRPHTWCPGPWWPPPPTPAPWWRPRLSSSAPTPQQTAGVEVSAVLSIAIITQESGSQDKQYTSIFLLFSYEAFYFLSICPKVT